MKRSSDLTEGNSSKKTEWDKKLSTIKQYIDKYNKLPSTRNQYPNIAALAKWYYDQKINYEQLSDEYKKKWDEFMTDYYDKIKTNKIWKDKLDKVKQFIQIHGKPPTLGNPEYKSLSKWLHNQKQRVSMKDDYTKKLWEEFNQQYLLSNHEWFDKLETLKKYIDEHLEIPLPEDECFEVRTLGTWLKRQKRYYLDKQLKEEYRSKWEEFTKDYSSYLITNQEEWHIKLNILKKYIDTHQEKPKQKVNYLGNWLYMQNQYYKLRKYNMKYDHIRKVWEEFNETYKKYLVLSEIWLNKLDNVKQYIETHQKLPSKDTELYNWIKTQQKNYQNNRLKEEYKQHWESFIDQHHTYFQIKFHRWIHMFEKIKIFIDTNHEFPSPYDSNKENRILGKWVHLQNYNYRTNRIRNPTIKEKWEVFKTQYYSPEIYWKIALNNVIHYMKTYKKIPSNEDKNRDIRGLYVWLNAQYNHYFKEYGAMKNPELRQLWEKFLWDHKDVIIFAK
jgi:hypothetical protein